jgi:hypothetical protein
VDSNARGPHDELLHVQRHQRVGRGVLEAVPARHASTPVSRVLPACVGGKRMIRTVTT